jgi:hypothetical protein
MSKVTVGLLSKTHTRNVCVCLGFRNAIEETRETELNLGFVGF